MCQCFLSGSYLNTLSKHKKVTARQYQVKHYLHEFNLFLTDECQSSRHTAITLERMFHSFQIPQVENCFKTFAYFIPIVSQCERLKNPEQHFLHVSETTVKRNNDLPNQLRSLQSVPRISCIVSDICGNSCPPTGKLIKITGLSLKAIHYLPLSGWWRADHETLFPSLKELPADSSSSRRRHERDHALFPQQLLCHALKMMKQESIIKG